MTPRCPGCQEPLRRVEPRLEQCPRCGGLWTDPPRLEEIYRGPEATAGLVEGYSLEMSLERPGLDRPCPVCRFPLSPDQFRVSPVERCPVCGGIWIERVHLMKWNLEW
ncbi:MAG: zf-TFIIB domain-containing protein [Armatimonadetes bacterium]|nr:zf-TFIIB domain-containing protein [Armatimonadota bacterium]